MTIIKGNSVYVVTESSNKWTVKKDGEKISVSVEVPKELCQTEDELREYVFSKDMF